MITASIKMGDSALSAEKSYDNSFNQDVKIALSADRSYDNSFKQDG